MTLEEKLEKLRTHDNWWSFTDPQRVWLAAMAEGLNPMQATKRAYHDCKSPVVMTKSLLARVGIQSALESIGLDHARPNITKAEAIKHLSRFMRLSKDATEYCKLLAQYARLQGWEKDEDPPPDGKDEVGFDEVVAAIEKKRKAKS